jgi:hypothetical protein
VRRLLGAGLALELALAVGFVLPLAIWRHPQVVRSGQPLATVLGTGAGGATGFALAVSAAFAVFALAMRAARGLSGATPAGVVLGAALLFSLTLAPMNPLASKDVFHNIVDARTLWVYGQNPTLTAPNAHPSDPLFASVSAWQAFPSSYGPLWYLIAGAPLPFAGTSLWANVIGQKLLTAAFLLASAGLALLIAERLKPGTGIAAAVLVGWNPLLQFETAGNAHNDIVMVFFALAAILALQRRWWAAVFPLLALAVAAKFVLVLLGPLFLLWLLRSRAELPRRTVLLSLALGVVVFLALGVRFFAGEATIEHFVQQARNITSSPPALLYAILHTTLHVGAARSAMSVKLAAASLFALTYLLLLRRLSARTELAELIGVSAWATFALLAIVTWWFWPWYVVLLVPLAALLPNSRVALVAAVFSLTAMLMYVPYFWLLHSETVLHTAGCVVVAFLPPALVALASLRRGKLASADLGVTAS